MTVARVLGGEPLDEVGALRPGADDRHLAAQDVPQLRQLVEGGGPQHPTHRPDPWVTHDGPLRRRLGLRRGPHGPELQALEAAPVAPDALLTEEDARPALPVDGDRAGE